MHAFNILLTHYLKCVNATLNNALSIAVKVTGVKYSHEV